MQYQGEDNLDVLKLAKNYNQFLVKSVCSLINQPNLQIVDFGSGEGDIAREVEKNSGNQVICIEPADNLQKFYHHQNCAKSLDEFSDGTIHYIYSLNVLEHIKDDVAVVDAFYRKLTPNGKIFLYLPAFNLLYSSMDKKVGHYRRYTKAALMQLFADKNKWKIEKLVYADFLGFFITLLFKCFGNKQGDISPVTLKFYDRFLFPVSRFLDKLTQGSILGKNVCIIVEKKSENQ